MLDFTFGSDFKGFIGLVYSANKVYTYNGLHNSWIEFTPQGGEYKDYCIGTKTALMVRNQMLYAFDPQAITGIENTYPIAFKNFDLKQNYPNPFNPSTKISWQSPIGSWQNLKIYDMLGNEVATLVDEYKTAGSYEVEFSAKGGSASGGNAYGLSSGVYFYQLKAGYPSTSSGQSFIQTKKMILLK